MDSKTEVMSGELYTAQDVVGVLVPKRSAGTIKRLADELHIPVKRTVGGVRIFTGEQVEKLRAEIERRQREDAR